MTEGKVVKWLMEEGAEVVAGTDVVEIETEKIASAVEAPVGGILRRRVAQEGDVVPVAGLLGEIADPGVQDDEIARLIDLGLAHPKRVSSITLIASAGLGPEINAEYVEGFISASRRNEPRPHLQKLFADPSLVNRQLVDDVLKFGSNALLSRRQIRLAPGCARLGCASDGVNRRGQRLVSER